MNVVLSSARIKVLHQKELSENLAEHPRTFRVYKKF
jgi:hypothetical protein